MTLATFIKELKVLRGKYKISRRAIRAPEEIGYCPIVGLARSKGFSSMNYSDCADYLGLSEAASESIIEAADGYTKTSARRQLRKKLLLALDLEG